MKLYHSSNVSVEKPDTAHSRQYLDFGQGFYLTSIYDQALRYAQRFKRLEEPAWLNTYELAKIDANNWKVKIFEAYDAEWLKFVGKCRSGQDKSDYDMVVGGIANDRVIATLDRYFAGEISERRALGLLRFEKPNIQYCIRSERMLNECLTYISSEQL